MPLRTPLRSLLALAGALLLSSGCAPEDSDPVTPDNPTLAISLASSSVAIVAGQSGQVGVNIVRGGGFSGAVTVTATAPAGVTIAPVTIPVGSTSATLSVQVGATVAAGTLQASVSASGAGVSTATTALAITVAPPPDFSIALAATTAAVQQGGSTTATVNITRTGGFAGAVTLTATGLPTGVTATFNPAAPTGNTSTLTLTAAAGATVGSSNVTVSATGQGVTGTKTTALALTVSAPAQTPAFSLAVTPTTVSVEQGKSVTATVAITRTGGFTGAVNLAVSGLPTGVTASFASPVMGAPSETTANQATLTLTAGATATTGTATLTITGTATGLTPRTATLGTTVTAASTGGGGGGSGNISLGFCGDEEIPVWAAYQDGSGPWTRVTADANQVFRFQVNADKGAFAYATTDEDGSYHFIWYYTRAEMIRLGSNPCAVGGGKEVNGSVSGLGALESAIISMGGSVANVNLGGPSTFTLPAVEDGPQDLIAARWALSLSGSTPSLTPNRMIIRRNLNPAPGSTLPVLNFATEGFAPASATMTITGGGAGEQAIFLGLFLTDKGGVSSYFVGVPSSSFTASYYGVPSAELRTGDVHLVQAIAATISTGESPIPPPTRQVGAVFREVTNRTVALGPALSTPTLTALSGGTHGRVRMQLPLQTEYRQYVAAAFNQEDQNDRQRVIQVLASGDYIGSGGTADLSIPDLSAVPGWNNAWGLVRGRSAIWTTTGTGWNGPGFLSFPNFVDGARFHSATRSGQITP